MAISAPFGLLRPRCASQLAIATAACVALNSTLVHAVTYTYTGATSNDVFLSGNWSPAGVPTGGDTIIFDDGVSGLLTLTSTASGSPTPTSGAGVLVNITSSSALTIDSTVTLWRYFGSSNAASSAALTIAPGAGAFSLGNGSGTTVNFALGATGTPGTGTYSTFTNNSSNLATINTDVNFAGGGNGYHVLALTGSGDWRLNNVIRNHTDITASDGEFGVAKSGSGIATLAGNNLYSRNTVITGGILRSTTNTALGYGGQYAINRPVGVTTVDGTNAASTLDIGGAAVVNEPITLNGSTNGASLINSDTAVNATIDSGIATVTFSNNGGTYGTSTGANSLTTTFSGGGGSGAAAIALKGSSAGSTINTIRMTAAGSGYTSAPTVTITGANGETGAVATAVLSSVTLNGTNNSIGGDGNLTIAASIRGTDGGFTKIGNGTLVLSGLNTYSGVTTVAAGTLLVNSNSGDIVVSAGTIGGVGTVGTLTINGGAVLAPGNSIGTLTAGDTVFAAGSIYSAEIGSGSNADSLIVNGALDLTAAGNVLDLVGLEADFDGSTKTLATYTSMAGAFDSVTLNGSPLTGTAAAFNVNGYTYGIDYGTGSNSSISLTVVPEPAMLGGVGVALSLLLPRRRRF